MYMVFYAVYKIPDYINGMYYSFFQCGLMVWKNP